MQESLFSSVYVVLYRLPQLGTPRVRQGPEHFLGNRVQFDGWKIFDETGDRLYRVLHTDFVQISVDVQLLIKISQVLFG